MMKLAILSATVLLSLLVVGSYVLFCQSQYNLVVQSPGKRVEQTEDMPNFPTLPDQINFQAQVQPLLSAQCFKCHGPQQQLGGLRLDVDPTHWFAGQSNSLSESKTGATNTLKRFLKSEKYLSPPYENCRPSQEHLQVLMTWLLETSIENGSEESPVFSSDWSEEEQNHWAFTPIVKPSIPGNDHPEWGRNPIDAFILEKLNRSGISPSQAATTSTLIRRLSLSITGLPPTLDQQHRYENADDSVLDQFVEELLSSTAYGEHWARFWLDLVRYADSNGYEHDSIKPEAWKYRDFVIQSLNQDRAYDKFLMQQLAGDLFDEPTTEDYIASGFLRLGAWDAEPNDGLIDRYDQLDEIVSTTSLVFLGMTLGCSRCHDHPEEPITSKDYARTIAIFHGLARQVKGRIEQAVASATPTQLAVAEKNRELQRKLLRQAILESDETKARQLREEAAKLSKQHRFDRAYRFVETMHSPTPTRQMNRGDPYRLGGSVSPGYPSILAQKSMTAVMPPRLQFARWLTDDRRDLTARLIVNRIWSWHFNRGIVESTNNFGIGGSEPTHSELLDWLADWFIHDANWSLKSLHRLILSSQTYRTSSEQAESNPKLAQLWGAFPIRQLRAEVIHDSMLTVSGLVSDKRSGPPTYPPLSEEAQATLTEKGKWRIPSRERRKAIYNVVQRNMPVPMLQAFHFPAGANSCPQRTSNLNTAQALELWNGSLADNCASAFANRIEKCVPGDRRSKVMFAFRSAMGREPEEKEIQNLLSFLAVQHKRTKTSTNEFESLQKMCIVLFNLNEFVFMN